MSERPPKPNNPNASRRPDGLIKISELARLSGVPAPTIKHYLREGLLPPAAKKTGRNMSWYDPAIVERIQTIKKLQRERFLPLKVIRDVLDNHSVRAGDQITALAIQRMLDARGQSDVTTVEQLIEKGLDPNDLAWLEEQGLVQVDGDALRGDDLAIAQVIIHARKTGLNREVMPIEALAHYRDAVDSLVHAEIAFFRGQIEAELIEADPTVAETALEVSEQLVMLLRRRALLPVFEQLILADSPST